MRTGNQTATLLLVLLTLACGGQELASTHEGMVPGEPDGSPAAMVFSPNAGLTLLPPAQSNPLALSAIPGPLPVPIATPFVLRVPNADQYFAFSTPFAAYYPHVSSLDFDLGLTYLGSPYNQMTCRVEFPIISPPTAYLANPDGITAQGAPFIRFGVENNGLINILKTRRIEVITTGSVAFSLDIECFLLAPLPNSPVIARVTPSLGAEQDLITIDGFNFAGTGTTVTLSGVTAPIQTITNNQIVIQVPVGAQTGPLVVRKSALLADQIGTFRDDTVVGEILTDLGGGPATGLLVSAFYPVGSIDAAGCPTLPEVYSLFTTNFSVASGSAVHDSGRVPPGTWDQLVWLDPATSFSLKPKAGSRRVQNFSNTVAVQAQQRASTSHSFSGTYPTDCP